MVITPRKLKEFFAQGKNITALLREQHNTSLNTEEIIELAYDLQAGSYIKGMESAVLSEHKREYSREIADIISSLCKPDSIMEAGVGEATTFSGVLKSLSPDITSYGFDISWSRVAYARQWLYKHELTTTHLCTGSLFEIPFMDNSIDVVYTSHSIEPNGGNEKAIITELYRVAKKYLILLEPGYELASDEVRQRMDAHGYCKNLKETAYSLGYNVLEHKLFPYSANPLNPTAITVIEKNESNLCSAGVFACPKYKTSLEELGGMMFSEEGLTVYPVIDGIPCLRTENGIIAGKYRELIQGR